MTRSEIEHLLPGVFQRAAQPGGPLAALLDVMEMLHEPAEDVLERLDAVFDPRRTPDGLVPYLATWLDLAPVLPVTTGLPCLRELVGAAAAFAQQRGTARGLILFLETATGTPGFEVDEQVLTPDGRPRPFHVLIRVPRSSAPHRAMLERIIELEKPAHVTYELSFGPSEGGS
jgi:phage tail-like protein